MFTVLNNSWALFLGMMLLMVGNGMQGTLLGIRGEIEGFSAFEISIVMSAYFAGFFGGTRATPEMLRRVGHVRVFAALGSLISAVLIVFPVFANPVVWILGRFVLGFAFSGVYVTAESWLNNASTNETRGKTLSIYVLVQMIGIVLAQGLMTISDPAGYELFILPSILVSIAFAPILLSVTPTPVFETTKPMTLRALFVISPLGCVGVFLLGGVYAAQFGMSAVFGAQNDLSVSQISLFVASFYIGATVFQYPVGWISDRMDRRMLIAIVAALAGVGAVLGILSGGEYKTLLISAAIVGGMSNPLYALLLAHTNDFLEYEDMAAASGGLLFINGLGAFLGPMVIGWLMGRFGPSAFFYVLATLLFVMGLYALFRMTRRAAIAVDDTTAYAPVLPTNTAVFVEAAQDYVYETALEEENEATDTDTSETK